MKELWFYNTTNLCTPEATLYYDSSLPLYWDNGLVLDFKYTNNPYNTIQFYHRSGVMAFNDSSQIVEFCQRYAKGSFPIYEEFSSKWGTWCFPALFASSVNEKLFSGIYHSVTDYYPEFILDVGEYIEEQLGKELEDGVGIVPVIPEGSFLGGTLKLRRLVATFLTRETYLKGLEVLESASYERDISGKALRFFTALESNLFDVETFKFIGSELKGVNKLKRVLKDLEAKIEAMETMETMPHVFSQNLCIRDFVFEVELREGISDNLINKKLHELRSELWGAIDTEYYGDNTYHQGLIATSDSFFDLRLLSRSNQRASIQLSTTIALY